MNSPADIGFDHRYIPGNGPAGTLTLLLLHGTGGDGDSLLQLGDTLRPGSALLSPTGNVSEQGMARFFRRFAEGVFDQEDLARRTDELVQFIHKAVSTYQLDASRIVAVGFSNGANIASSVLLTQPDVFAGAVLLRPMLPFMPDPMPRVPAIPVFVASGMTDPVVPPANVDALVQLLRTTGCDVTIHQEAGGHELTLGDVRAAQRWMQRYYAIPTA